MTRSSALKLVQPENAEETETTEPEFKDGDGDDGGSFGVGSLVGLKSGGPAMTVLGRDPDTSYILVAWFADADLSSVSLPYDALEEVDLIDE